MSEDKREQGGHFQFFSNRECEYFPCHPTDDPENFNCLFCYCPLYALGDQCGGNFTYIGDLCKDCSNCMLPHVRENYWYITGRYPQVMELAAQNRKGKGGRGERQEPE